MKPVLLRNCACLYCQPELPSSSLTSESHISHSLISSANILFQFLLCGNHYFHGGDATLRQSPFSTEPKARHLPTCTKLFASVSLSSSLGCELTDGGYIICLILVYSDQYSVHGGYSYIWIIAHTEWLDFTGGEKWNWAPEIKHCWSQRIWYLMCIFFWPAKCCLFEFQLRPASKTWKILHNYPNLQLLLKKPTFLIPSHHPAPLEKAWLLHFSVTPTTPYYITHV